MPACDDLQETFVVNVRLYSKNQAYDLQSIKTDCSSSQIKILVKSQSDIPKFKIIDKIEITSTATLKEYKVVWYNAQP